MKKEEQIRLMAATLLPHTRQDADAHKWCVDTAIRYATVLYERTGGDQPAKVRGPNEIVNHYRELSESQRKAFDRFWKAFDYKEKKQDAAKAWLQLTPGPEEAERIIAAAQAEARKERPEGIARKQAPGWLRDLRFDDYDNRQERQAQAASSAIRETMQALAHAKRMAESDPNQSEYWQGEIQKCNDKLRALRP